MDTRSGELIKKYNDLILAKYSELGLTRDQAISIITYADAAMFFEANEYRFLDFILNLYWVDKMEAAIKAG